MSNAAVLALLLTLALVGLGAACEGGDDGEEGVERVPIRRLDFTGMELSVADYLDPPLAEQYPDVVAEVNGEPITGRDLAAQQVQLELNLRQLNEEEFADFLAADLASLQLAQIESTDPLEALIDQALLHQAVERLDFLPPREEAVDFTREAEASYRSTLQEGDAEERVEALERLRLLDIPTEDWASDEEMVEGYRLALGVAALRQEHCAPASTPASPTPGVVAGSIGAYDCTGFLQTEREDADIQYLVEWADEGSGPQEP